MKQPRLAVCSPVSPGSGPRDCVDLLEWSVEPNIWKDELYMSGLVCDKIQPDICYQVTCQKCLRLTIMIYIS